MRSSLYVTEQGIQSPVFGHMTADETADELPDETPDVTADVTASDPAVTSAFSFDCSSAFPFVLSSARPQATISIARTKNRLNVSSLPSPVPS